MAEACGLWPGVVAIVGDADIYCVMCAKNMYGSLEVQAVVDGSPGYERYRDNEGNALGVVLRLSEDLHRQTCRVCRIKLCDEDCFCYSQFGDGDVWIE